MPIFEDQYAPISDGHLPVQLPAVEEAGNDPSGHYASLPQPVAVFNSLDGIIYTYSTITSPLGVKSMFSGMVSYLPANTNYTPGLSGFTVNSEIATTAQGGVLLELFPIVGQALKTLPDTPDGASPLDGVFIPAYILIEGVDATAFRSDMQTLIPDVADAILDLSWMETEGSTPGTREEKENKFLDRLMLGEKQLAVGGGDDIGTTVLNADNHPEFTLKMYSSEVESGTVAVFYASRVDPLLFVQRFPSFIDPTDPANSYFSKWHNHPLITAIADFSANVMRAYIKFEVWNPDSLTGAVLEYAPVDPGLTVKLMDYDTILNADDELASTTTNDNGVAFFQIDIPEDGWLNGSPPDMYFKILAPTASMASGLPALPAEWSTKASSGTDHWLSTSGKKGYYENFNGTQLGSPANPLVFRIGLDFHVKFQYYDLVNSRYRNLIDGITIELHDTAPTPSMDSTELIYETPKHTFVTSNNQAEGHGVIFEIEPGKDIYWRVICGIVDANLGMDVVVHQVQEIQQVGVPINHALELDGYTTRTNSGVQILNTGAVNISSIDEFEKFQRPSVGSNAAPVILSTLSTGDDQSRASIYVLKIAKELALFYDNLAQGNNHPISNTYRFSTLGNLTYDQQISYNVAAHAVPVDVVQLTDRSGSWRRETIVHESSHHVYWHAVDYSTLNIIREALPGGQLILRHSSNLFYHEEHALIEGFPEAIAHVFAGLYYQLYSFTDDDGNTGYSLGPTVADEVNRGEKIEGIVSNAIGQIFWSLVVTPHHSLSVLKVEESNDGNIITKNPWLQNTAIQASFMDIIWSPLVQLINSSGDPNSTAYFENMLLANPAIAHKIRGILNTYNIAVTPPDINSLSPSSGVLSGGTKVTVSGMNFLESFTANNLGRTAYLEVWFGNSRGYGLNIIDQDTLEVFTPTSSQSGSINVRIELVLTGHAASQTSGSTSSTRGLPTYFAVNGISALIFTYN